MEEIETGVDYLETDSWQLMEGYDKIQNIEYTGNVCFVSIPNKTDFPLGKRYSHLKARIGAGKTVFEK